MMRFMNRALGCAAVLALLAFLAPGGPAVATEKTMTSEHTYLAENGSSPSACLKIEADGSPAPETRQPAASAAQIPSPPYMPDSLSSQATESQLSDLSREVAGKVYYTLKEDGGQNDSARVAVVAAVPLSDLKHDTEFGRVMAEYLLTDLADRGLKVTELRLGKEINILPQTGEFILSRNLGELANVSPPLDYVVVSTFSNTRKTLILQGRLVSLQDGLIKTSWRYTLPLTRDLLSFFQLDAQPTTIRVKGMHH